MAVEILILSGARQSERLVFDGREFRVGSDTGCDVCFDPERDSAIQGRSALFRLQDDGWHIRCTAGVLVNQQPATKTTRIRSGDVIRMSEDGPDFSFGIVTRATATQAPRSPSGVVSPRPEASDSYPTHEEVTEIDVQLDSPSRAPAIRAGKEWYGSKPISSAGATAADEVPEDAISRQSPMPASVTPAAVNPGRVIWLVGGLVIGVLLLLALRSVFMPPTVVINLPGASATQGAASSRNEPPVDGSGSTGSQGVAGGSGATEGSTSATNAVSTPIPPPTRAPAPAGGDAAGTERPNEPDKKEAGPSTQDTSADRADKEQDSWAAVARQLEEAVFLIQAEKLGKFWPCGTCVAVGPDTLLTTADVASQLAGLREKDDFKIWVTRPARDLKEEVQEIRISQACADLADKPDQCIYHNLGLLTMRGGLPAVGLASPEQLAALEDGLPLACFGFPYKQEKITRFDKLAPHLSPGRIDFITVARPDQPRIRMVHMRAKIPENAFGSPVVGADGKVVGVYSRVNQPPGGKQPASGGADLNLHDVTLVNLETISQWLRDRSDKAWLLLSSPKRPQ